MKENSPNFSFQGGSIFGKIKDSPSDNEGFFDNTKTILSNRSGLTQPAKYKSLQISDEKNLFKSEGNLNNTEKRELGFEEGGHFSNHVAPFEETTKAQAQPSKLPIKHQDSFFNTFEMVSYPNSPLSRGFNRTVNNDASVKDEFMDTDV